ncbi:MAG: osmotically inducible protein OsmC [Bacteroidetes bacterium HGW-Bacteroidetes-21]|nr:MAG: osmotically inducible protein OsmC [Bacteroidetes bacterium HGW-Bacteroidetes-21]
MKDKSKELDTSLTLINDKLNFIGSNGYNDPISIDYLPPLGDNLGYTSLELLLLSLSSCIGSAVLTFLRKMNREISFCKINAKGLRREEHPTCFSKIIVEISVGSSNVTDEDMAKVIQLSEDKYCPVYAMIKGNAEINIEYKIEN